MSPKMSLADVAGEFRKHGISIDNARLADGIEDGTYPFGRLVNKSQATGRRTFEIWRKDVLAFLTDLNPGTAPVPMPTVPPMPTQQPACIPVKAASVIKWATVCSNPHHQEADCMACPYRTKGLCTDALLADAASVLMDMTLGVACT